MLRATLRFQLSLAILVFFSCATIPICQGEDVTAEQDPCVSSSKDYRPTDEEIGDDEDRYFALRDPRFDYHGEERWIEELGDDAKSYVLAHVDHSDARTRNNAIYLLRAADVDTDQANKIYRAHLSDPCRKVQAVAAMRLVEDGVYAPEVISALVRNVDHQWYDVRRTVQGLGNIAIRPCATFMADPSQPLELRKKVSEEFPIWVDADDPSLQPLYDALESDDRDTRALAAFQLLKYKPHDNHQIAKVLAELSEQESPVADDAFVALRNMWPKPPAAIVNPAVLRWISTPGRPDIDYAFHALVIDSSSTELVEKLVELAENGVHSDEIFVYLARHPELKPPRIDLLQFLKDKIIHEPRSFSLASNLFGMGIPGQKTLLEISLDSNMTAETRMSCIFALRAFENEQEGQQVFSEQEWNALVSLLEDKEPSVAQAVAIMLTNLGQTSRDLTPLLVSAWLPNANNDIRFAAEEAIPANPAYATELITKLAKLCLELPEDSDREPLVRFLSDYGATSIESQDAIVDAIVNHVDVDAPYLFDYERMNMQLFRRLEREIPQNTGSKQQKILQVLRNVFDEAEWYDGDLTRILAQTPPDGLDELLDSQDDKIRHSALILYSYYSPKDPKIVRRLLDVVKAESEFGSGVDWETAMEAEKRLNKAGEALEPLLPELIEMLDSPDEYPSAATTLLETLGPKASPAVGKLTELLANDEPSNFKFTCSTLAAIGPAAISAAPTILEYGQEPHRLETVARTLRAIEADTSVLIEPFDRKLADPFHQYDALRELSELAPAPIVAERYAAALEGDNWNMRLVALRELSLTDVKDPRRIVPLLIAGTNSKSISYRRGAVQALGTQSGLASQSVPALVDVMKNDPEMTFTAILALGNLGPEAAAAVPDLRSYLEDEDHAVATIRTLGRIGEPAAAAVPVIIEYLAGKRQSKKPLYFPSPVDAAIESLGNFGPAAKPALPLLLEMYHDSNHWETKQKIAQSIYQISPGFGAVNGIPQPPEPEPVRMQWSW